MNDSMKEFIPQSTEALSLNSIEASLNRTVSNRFKNLIPEKARTIAKAVSQRAILTATGVSLIIGAGCGNTEGVKVTIIHAPTPISTPFIPAETPTPIPEATKIPEPIQTSIPTEEFKEPDFYNRYDFGVKVTFTKDNIPVKYRLEDGQEFFFDKSEVERIRQEAISSGEPQILKIVLLDNKRMSAIPANKSIEHPKVPDLPADVISEKELEKRGVNIIQSAYTNFFIREGAFSENGLLADFNNTGRNLTIVLTSGSLIDSKYLNDPKYQYLKRVLPPEAWSVDDLRSQRIKVAEMGLEYNRQSMKEAQRQNQSEDLSSIYNNYEVPLVSSKMQMYKYKFIMSNDQIAKETQGNHGYYMGDKTNPITVVFLGGQTYNTLAIYFDIKGHGKIKGFPGGEELFVPKGEQTHPNPQDFILNTYASADRPSSYPYAAQSLGLTLRHELKHDKLIQQKINKGEAPNYSEYDTDINAMEGIRDAWEEWKNSGYTDNSGYHFVFSLSPEQGGGYILTSRVKTNNLSPDNM